VLGIPVPEIVTVTDGVRDTVTEGVARKELGAGDGDRVIDRVRVILTVPEIVLERVCEIVPEDVRYGVAVTGDTVCTTVKVPEIDTV